MLMLTLTATYERRDVPAPCINHPLHAAEWVQILDDGDRPLCADCLPEWMRGRG